MDNLWQRAVNLIDQNELVAFFGRVLISLVVLLLALVIGRLVRRTIRHVAGRTSRNTNLPILLGNLSYVGAITVGILAILSIFTREGFSTFLTVLGLLSLAISLSVQDVLKNFVSGVYLLLEQPFSIGDRIKIKEFEGKIENIEIRTTSIRTDEGVQVFVPNSIVFAEVVTNRTAYSQRQTTLRFSLPAAELDFEELCQKVKTVLLDLGSSEVSIAPEPQIFVEAISAEVLKARLEFWSPIHAPLSTSSTAMLALSKVLPEADFNGAGLLPVPVPPPPVV